MLHALASSIVLCLSCTRCCLMIQWHARHGSITEILGVTPAVQPKLPLLQPCLGPPIFANFARILLPAQTWKHEDRERCSVVHLFRYVIRLFSARHDHSAKKLQIQKNASFFSVAAVVRVLCSPECVNVCSLCIGV